MEKIEAAKVSFTTANCRLRRLGRGAGDCREDRNESIHRGPLPDILAYLQNETELTRSTLVRILKESGRLAEFFLDPQRFMDAVAASQVRACTG